MWSSETSLFLVRGAGCRDAFRMLIGYLVSQRGVVFFRDQDIEIDDQKILGAKLGELSGKPESSKLHIHPITEETSEVRTDHGRPHSVKVTFLWMLSWAMK